MILTGKNKLNKNEEASNPKMKVKERILPHLSQKEFPTTRKQIAQGAAKN